ncbi:MAG TPA: MFS transporter [Ktedonobacterales bacterium]
MPRLVAGARAMSGPERVAVLIGLALLMGLAGLAGSVVGDIMPEIIVDLNGYASGLYVWVVTAHLFTFMAAAVMSLSLIEQFGGRRVLLAGAVVALAGAVLCGAAQTIQQLVAFRMLQGVGAGVCFGIFPQITRTGYLAPNLLARQSIPTVLVVVLVIAGFSGPQVGVWLVAHAPLVVPLITNASRWRWVFYVQALVAMVALILLWSALPRDRPAAPPRWTPIVRGALAAGACFLALLGSAWGQYIYSWQSWPTLGALVGAAALAALNLALGRFERRTGGLSQPARRIRE